MIRFIDICNQGTGERFAFFNTVNNKFFEFDNEQAWTNWNEFEVALINEAYHEQMEPNQFGEDCLLTIEEIDRYKFLCPEWVFDKEEDNIEDFYG